MNDINRLNANVTLATRKVQNAQAELADAQLEIARETSPNSTEGQIARRGFIIAAQRALLFDEVRSNLQVFLAEEGISQNLKIELRMLASSESEGQWFLVYSTNTFFSGDPLDNRVRLNAKTFVEAIAEGLERWRGVLDSANSMWQGQKNIYDNPPMTAFNGADPNPRIVCNDFSVCLM